MNIPLNAPQNVANRIIALRRALGMTKAEMADFLQIDRSSWTKVEKGEKRLLADTAFELSEAFGVPMDYLYRGRLENLPSNLSATIIENLKLRQR